MKKTLLSLALISTLALGACNKTADDVATDIRTTTATVNEKVKEVQSYAVRACGYLPYVAGITALFNASVGQSVSSIGSAICDAVNNAPKADGPANFRVNGVLVRGQFVR